MRAVKSVSIDSERRVIITYLDGSTETLYPNCIWCDSEALRQLIKDLLEEKADAITQTIENVSIATFADGADEGMIKKLLVSIDPIQDLHGYGCPWSGGGGKNIAPYSVESSLFVGFSSMIWENGYVSNEVISTSTGFSFSRVNANYGCGIILGKLEEGQTYTLKATRSIPEWRCTITTFDADAVLSTNTGVQRTVEYDSINIENGFTFTAHGENVKYAVGFYNSDSSQLLFEVSNIQLEKSQTATEWTPYSNICPISGRTGLSVVRCGVNVWDEEWERANINWDTYKFTPADNGTRLIPKNFVPVLSGKQYYITRYNKNALVGYADKNSNGIFINQNSGVFTVPDGIRFIKFGIDVNTYGTTYNHNISINYPSTDHDYHEGHVQIVTIDLGDPIYGGMLDVVSGKLIVDRGYIASYNGEALPSTWISDRDVYAEGTTPTTGAQVVYTLAQPIEYQLTPQEVTTLLGDNNIWSDGGDMAVEYPADTKLYIDQKITEAIAAAMA